jgi:UDP-2,4-diacetamido-2,4,6-trideoxy-beta-L-altropyranose hydrolase
MSPILRFMRPGLPGRERWALTTSQGGFSIIAMTAFPPSMAVAFLCNASPEIGGGHVMRCLTLALALRVQGADVRFFSRVGTSETVPALTRSGLVVDTVGSDPASWVAAIRAWHAGGVDLAVVDSYAAGAAQQTVLRSAARRLMVIDDLANRVHDCDVLLDQNLGRNVADYAGLVPPSCQVLVGPPYALLRPEFAAARPRALARRQATYEAGTPVRRIIVSLGLTDLGGITARVVTALLAADTDAAIDVVVGSRAPSLPALRDLAAVHDCLTLHIDPPDICELMVAADLAVGAAGSTSWERCCLGLPTLILVLAENQRPGACALVEAGAAMIGIPEPIDDRNDDAEHLRRAIRRLCFDHEVARGMSKVSSTICDGAGTETVVMSLALAVSVELAPATMQDCELLWRIRNEPSTRAMFKNSDPVTLDVHRSWLKRCLIDPDTLLLIGRVTGEPLGYVRFDRQPDGTAKVSVSVTGERRGQGLGGHLFAEGCRIAGSQRFASVLRAEIKRENAASLAMCLATGFVITNNTGELVIMSRSELGPVEAWDAAKVHVST